MRMHNTLLVPSLLSADFFALSDAYALFEQYGVERIHIDIMDGHFVPPISIGYPVIRSIRSRASYFFDAHLMVTNPESHVQQCADAGCDAFTFHFESTRHIHRLIQSIRAHKMQAGVALLPKTPIDALDYFIEAVDIVLLMFVDPGFGGQELIPSMMPKLEKLQQYKEDTKCNFAISVDGGVTPENAGELLNRGANYLISGSSFFDDSIRARFLEYPKKE